MTGPAITGRAETRETDPAAARATDRLTVVIPVYDEARRIEGVVAGVARVLSGMSRPGRVWILNDGSNDWHPALERRLLERGPVSVRSSYPNRGKGAVLSRTFSELGEGISVIIDADGEYDPEDIPRVIEPLAAGRADWVWGSRYGFDRARPRQYLLTYAANRSINRWFSLLSGLGFHDLLTGIYGFRNEVVAGLRLRERRFAYSAELIWKVVHRGGVRWEEVPASYRFRAYGEGKKIRWWETATILFALLRYKYAGPSRR